MIKGLTGVRAEWNRRIVKITDGARKHGYSEKNARLRVSYENEEITLTADNVTRSLIIPTQREIQEKSDKESCSNASTRSESGSNTPNSLTSSRTNQQSSYSTNSNSG